MLFRLSTPELALLIFGATLGATALGAYIGHRFRHLSDSLTEPFGIVQGAMLGVVGLILAFGLSLSLSRYQDRRAAIVTEANAIGTTFLRAQTLQEPIRGDSLELISEYTDNAILLSERVPGSAAENVAIDHEQEFQRDLWALAGRALDGSPVQSAPRLYVETLNEMIDAQTIRVAALNNQVPTAAPRISSSRTAVALGLLSAYLAIIGRGIAGAIIAATVIAALLFITADLDRPTRGLIKIPDAVLIELRESMDMPPAAAAPAPVPGRPG